MGVIVKPWLDPATNTKDRTIHQDKGIRFGMAISYVLIGFRPVRVCLNNLHVPSGLVTIINFQFLGLQILPI